MLRTLTALLLLAGSALGADYQCRNTFGCTAQISENGQLKTVNFRKGDIICTEDGWIVSTEDGWKKLKPKRRTPPTASGTSIGYFFESSAQARGPFVIYRAISPALSQRWNGSLVLVSAGEFVASGYDTPTGPGWMEVGKQKGTL